MINSLFLVLLVYMTANVISFQPQKTFKNVVVSHSLRAPSHSKSSSSKGRCRLIMRGTVPSELSSTMPIAVTASNDGGGLKQKLKVGGLFGLWYALNVGYNIYNKKVLNLVPGLTYTVAFLQLFLGLAYVAGLWGSGARKAPVLNKAEVKTLMPVALLHCLTHLGAIVSLGAGAVSFTHIVKAAEPAVSAGLSAVILKQFLPLPVALTLIPVMGGVAIASLTELSFSWLAFSGAMISNFASAGRGIVGKMQMGKSVGKNMDAANLYAVMTIISSALCLPLALLLEGKNLQPILTAIEAAGLSKTLYTQTLLSAVFYYLYNEVAFLTLDNVAPVTHALGNTIKRVVIILASVVWLGSNMTTQGAFGSTLAIGGVLLYSLAKNKFK
jgi:solute carrier family 35 protein E1